MLTDVNINSPVEHCPSSLYPGDKDIQQQVLGEVDDDEYLSVLRPLLKQKRRSVKAANDYELNQKLVKFALSRGFTYDIIRQCIDGDVDEMVDDEE